MRIVFTMVSDTHYNRYGLTGFIKVHSGTVSSAFYTYFLHIYPLFTDIKNLKDVCASR